HYCTEVALDVFGHRPHSLEFVVGEDAGTRRGFARQAQSVEGRAVDVAALLCPAEKRAGIHECVVGFRWRVFGETVDDARYLRGRDFFETAGCERRNKVPVEGFLVIVSGARA